MLNLPKFEKCAGRDDLRESMQSMQYISMESDYTVVTDAHKLLWVQSEYPNELMDFIEAEQAIYVHADQWKKVSGKNVEFVAVDTHSLVFKDAKKGGKIFLEYFTKNKAPFRYPDWKQVLPVDLDKKESRFDIQQLNTIGIDVNHLKAIQEAWNMGKDVTYRMEFFGYSRAILITENTKDPLHWSKKGAILMPCLVKPSVNSFPLPENNS